MQSDGVKVIFEDNHVIVAVKPAGVLSQADLTTAPDMLTILKAYIKEKYQKPGNVYLGLVHRLDRPVEGLMVFAKTSKAASRLSGQIRERKITKRYRAVVYGRLPDSGRFENYILKDSGSNTVTVYDAPHKDAKRSYLDYSCTGRGNLMGRDVSLADIELGTGRSHQIRSQFSHAGFPLVGDRKYGKKDDFRGDICLQSYLLGFDHPTTGEHLEFRLDAGDRSPWDLFEVK